MQSAISPHWTTVRPAARSRRGIVASQNSRAAAAGAAILRAGGNAVDAAVATSFALAATEPWMSGLGGGGYMLIWLAREQAFRAIEFGMVAPRDLDPADYPLGGTVAGDIVFGWPAVVDDRNLLGPLAIGLPGQVDGVGLALEKFGTRSLAEVMAPAIRLAEEGVGIDWYASMIITVAARGLGKFPESRAAWLPGGLPPTPGWDGIVKPLPLGQLAGTMRTIAAEGRRVFYEGKLADSIVADLQAAGARIDRQDFAGYQARLVEPVSTHHAGCTIAGVSGMTSGPTIIECFEALESARPGAAPDAGTFVAYADILQRKTNARLATMGHADSRTAPSCTSHFCVVDAKGNMVSTTQTLVSLFGSKVVLPQTGILMNNSIMTFDPEPGRPNSIAPGQRPLANMCPIAAVRDGQPVFALGASGGRRIMPAVFQIADFLSRFRMPLEDAFLQPRIDSSGSDIVSVDPRLPAPVRAALATRFRTVEESRTIYPLPYACASAVLVGADGMRQGMVETMMPWADAVAEDSFA
jgi:gamma-glutamyltranspeptidase/glutathione hydrolase